MRRSNLDSAQQRAAARYRKANRSLLAEKEATRRNSKVLVSLFVFVVIESASAISNELAALCYTPPNTVEPSILVIASYHQFCTFLPLATLLIYRCTNSVHALSCLCVLSSPPLDHLPEVRETYH
jgi:hypothetical protein